MNTQKKKIIKEERKCRKRSGRVEVKKKSKEVENFLVVEIRKYTSKEELSLL